jgi:hypothetical protein
LAQRIHWWRHIVVRRSCGCSPRRGSKRCDRVARGRSKSNPNDTTNDTCRLTDPANASNRRHRPDTKQHTPSPSNALNDATANTANPSDASRDEATVADATSSKGGTKAKAKAKVQKAKAKAMVQKGKIKARKEKAAKAKVDAKEKAKKKEDDDLAKFQAQQWIKHCIKLSLKNKDKELKGKR